MPEPFDPYYTWLGIPPHEQPANHYRLLGISLFEANPEVISNAADRLMLHLRAFQGGKRSKESQQLLNEISAARVCLLSGEKKAAYDARLQEEQDLKLAAELPPGAASLPLSAAPLPPGAAALPPGAAGPPPMAAAAGLPPATVLAGPAAAMRPAVHLHSRPPRRAAAKSGSRSLAFWIIGGSLAVLALAIIAAVLATRQGRQAAAPVDPAASTSSASAVAATTVPAPVSEPNRVADVSTAAPSASMTPQPPAPPTTAPSPAPLATVPAPSENASPVNSPSPNPQSGEGKPPAQPPPSPPPNPSPAPAPSPPAKTPPAKTPPAKKKGKAQGKGQPFADAAGAAKAISDAVKVVQAAHATQYAAAKKPEQKLSLARSLREEADQAIDDAPRRAALMEEAQRFARDGGDVRLALTMLRDRAPLAGIDQLVETVEILKTANYPAAQRAENAAVAGLASQHMDEAIASDRLDAAEALAKTATATYGKLRNVDAVNRLRERQGEIAAMKSEYEKIRPAVQVLQNKPKNPQANTAVGRYECFFKNDWEQGLTRLAQGSDQELAGTARKENENPTATAAGTLADQWWEIAQKQPPAAKRNVLKHAAGWYLAAVSSLTGRPQELALKRIDQATPTRGEPTALVPQGLIGYWNFDEGAGRLAQDTTKNKHHALLVGADWTRGVNGYALRIDAQDEYAEVLAPVALKQWTVALWVRPEAVRLSGGLFMANSTAQPNLQGNVHLYIRGDNTVEGRLFNSAGSSPHTQLELGKWQHIVFRYMANEKQANGEVLINGASDSQFGANKDIPPLLGPARIGGWWDDQDRVLAGAIDEVRLYGRVLNNDEIAALVAAGSAER
jgi:hypothetical protein